ncbi:unnamed protein product [Discula destructiva]
MDLLPTALYTLIDLSVSEAQLQQVHQACESGCVETGNAPNSCVQIASEAKFVGQPLRTVFDYHVELRTRDPLEYDPKHFIVVIDEEWQTKGVLLVTLDDGESEGESETRNVDSFVIKAQDAGLSIVNIQIGNSDWGELKSNYELHSDDKDKDDAGGGDSSHAGADAGSNDDPGGPPAPKESSLMGFYIPIYIHSQVQPDDVIERLEPMKRHKTPEQYVCRIQASLTPSSSSSSLSSNDLVAQAAALHPLRCAKNRWLHQKMFLVIDTPDPVENGMVMCRLDWAGLTEVGDGTVPRTTSALADMGATLADSLGYNSTIRIRYSCAYGLQSPFLTLAHGDETWPSEAARRQPKFGVFQYNTPGEVRGFGAGLLDSGAACKQEYGQEQLVYDQEVEARDEFNGEAGSFDEAVQRFPMFCRENRIVENLDKTYFICIDRVDINQAGVLLARRRWDGNVQGRTYRELVKLEINDVRSARVSAKFAINLLVKGRVGDTEGMGPDLLEFFSG